MDALSHPLVRSLDRLLPLSDQEHEILHASMTDVVSVEGDRDLIREGERPSDCNVLLDGMTFRYRLTAEGRRQILSFHVPGDVFDAQSFLLEEMDHSVATLTACRIGILPHRVVRKLTEAHPRIARALWKATLVDAAIAREWMVSLGRRSARQALAHLLCELVARLEAVGRAPRRSIELPLTQTEIGDALGLSNVHVNRTLRELREDGLVATQGRTLAVCDWERLSQVAAFNPRYLHKENGRGDNGPGDNGQQHN